MLQVPGGVPFVTIAAVHVSPEGVVLGADSTTTIIGGHHPCYFDHAQKLFEVGPGGSSLGLLTWGIGQLGQISHRTVAARLGAQHGTTPFPSMSAMAQALGNLVWGLYSSAFAAELARAAQLLPGFRAGTLTDQERVEWANIEALGGGYCLAGRIGTPDECEAYAVEFDPISAAPTITQLPQERPIFWGIPKFAYRLAVGADEDLIASIFNSPQWTGTYDDLLALVFQSGLTVTPRNLPLREAADWIHTIIHVTIRGLKFAQDPHYCGGPIEIAAITNDRPFRWVKHKKLNSAIRGI